MATHTAHIHPGQTVASQVKLEPEKDMVVNVQGTDIEFDTDGLRRTTTDQNYLVVSPYLDQEHQLDLRTLEQENALFAQALVQLRSLRPDYATAPYVETFNWAEIAERLRHLVKSTNHQWRKTSWFIVGFRSRIPPTTVYSKLGELDKASHAEATASGGLLKYWFGTPDQEGQNLATCVWRSQEDAKKAGVGPDHRKAAGATRNLYTNWRIERYRFTVDEDLSWNIDNWA